MCFSGASVSDLEVQAIGHFISLADAKNSEMLEVAKGLSEEATVDYSSSSC